MDIFNVLGENSAYVYAVAIVVTIIALAISTRFSLRNLFNIRAAGEVPQSSEATEGKPRDEPAPYDATGNDGDDEADEGDEDAADEVLPTLTGQPISPRYPDPVDYCEHIQGEIKRVQQAVATRSIAESLTDQQLQEEREVQRKQLSEIFRLMQEQEDRFGIGSMEDMQEQMRLYAV